jgi:hypothetical protein
MENAKGGFDLQSNDARSVAETEDAGVWVDCRKANGDPMMYTVIEGEGEAEKSVEKQARILVAGTYSNVYRRAQDKQRDKMLRMRRSKMTGAEMLTQQLELAAACCINWEGFISNGKLVLCNAQNALAVLAVAPWIREDVEAQMTDHASFFSTPDNG